MDEPQQLRQWLINVATSRDNHAFSQLFKWFAPKIIRFGISKLNTEAAAHELLQNTMTKVWHKAHLYNPDKGASTTWVYTVMRNVCFDMLRKMQSQREDTLSEDIWPTIESEVAEDVKFEDCFEQRQMAKYIDILPKAQKDIIQGIYFQDLTQEQLAEHLDIPLGTVKSRLRLALAKLKQHIGEKS